MIYEVRLLNKNGAVLMNGVKTYKYKKVALRNAEKLTPPTNHPNYPYSSVEVLSYSHTSGRYQSIQTFAPKF